MSLNLTEPPGKLRVAYERYKEQMRKEKEKPTEVAKPTEETKKEMVRKAKLKTWEENSDRTI